MSGLNKKLNVVLFNFIIISGLVFSQTNDYERNVLNFNVQGIKLGCSIEDFLSSTKFTSEYYSNFSQPEVNQKVYVSSDVPNMTSCVFRFYNNKLYEVRLLYSP